MISHLQFADDTIIMVEGSERNLLVVKALITCFELVSGFSVNWTKSSFSGISLFESDCSRYARILGCNHKGWPTDYLGLRLGGSPRSKTFWEPVLERCRKRFALSKANYLSFGGRFTLIKATFLIYQSITFHYSRSLEV